MVPCLARLSLFEEAAEAANKAKSDFLANLSHEIRTPLNAILGYAQILQSDLSLQPEHRNAVEAVAANGAHLLTLINEVLDLAKIEARRMEMHAVDFSLNALLQDLHVMFKPRCTQKQLTMRLEPVSTHYDLVHLDRQTDFCGEGAMSISWDTTFLTPAPALSRSAVCLPRCVKTGVTSFQN